MIKTKDELLASIKEHFGDDTSDSTLALIEDITDTVSDYESKTQDNTNWKDKYDENDKMWREKYRDRFFNSSGEDPDPEPEPEKEILTFEDLFK